VRLLVISCSLSSASRSARMAERLAEAAWDRGDEVEALDLRRLALPFCDGGSAPSDNAGDEARDEANRNVATVAARIAAADAIALAVPIYNYDVGGAARNLIATTGRVWTDKVVGLLAAAGGQRSYMSLMPLANSLMLDFRCAIVPRFVYASAASFAGGELRDPDVEARLDALAADLCRFARGLASGAEEPARV